MRISVVVPALILNYDLLEQAKRSIESFNGDNIELIIVDNGSKVGSKYLKSKADIYLHYPGRIGFGRACNKGLAKATGDYLAVCSIDVEYKEGNFYDLASLYEHSAVNIGAICPSATNKGQVKEDRMFQNQTEGSSFLLSREVYEKVKLPEGLYDERYEHGYYEDTDLWKRLEQHNFVVARAGQVLITHGEGTTNKYLGVVDKYMEENRQKYIDKWNEEPTWRG